MCDVLNWSQQASSFLARLNGPSSGDLYGP